MHLAPNQPYGVVGRKHVLQETFGAMAKTEKIAFILEQVRLCLAKKDYIRAQILARKIAPKAFVERKGEGKGEIGIEGTAIEAADEVSDGCLKLLSSTTCSVAVCAEFLWMLTSGCGQAYMFAWALLPAKLLAKLPALLVLVSFPAVCNTAIECRELCVAQS